MQAKYVAAAIAAAVLASTAQAEPANGQDFEALAVGTEKADFQPAPDFGWFTGGTVERPGETVDEWFRLGGNQVYYGTDILYTNILDPMDPGLAGHCCGHFVMEMRVSSKAPVVVRFYGHAGVPSEDNYWPEAVMFETLLSGQDQYLLWGEEPPFDWSDPEWQASQGSDITSIRWTSLDGTAFAIDDVHGLGTAAIPEPASWALMIAGFGITGLMLRRRQHALA